MGKETIKEKVRTLFHPSAKASASDTESIASLIKEAPKALKLTDVARTPYNGDQCFGSCCRGNGYAR